MASGFLQGLFHLQSMEKASFELEDINQAVLEIFQIIYPTAKLVPIHLNYPHVNPYDHNVVIAIEGRVNITYMVELRESELNKTHFKTAVMRHVVHVTREALNVKIDHYGNNAFNNELQMGGGTNDVAGADSDRK